jgi:hypothetical protein
VLFFGERNVRFYLNLFKVFLRLTAEDDFCVLITFHSRGYDSNVSVEQIVHLDPVETVGYRAFVGRLYARETGTCDDVTIVQGIEVSV